MLGHRFRRISGVLTAGLVMLLSGCSYDYSNWFHFPDISSLAILDPVGPVGSTERDLIIVTFLIMLFVLIPVVALTVGFAWRYRASNTKATYEPRWAHSWIVEIFTWGGPVVIVVILGIVTWISTHDLDPYKAIKSDAKPIRIDAVALSWKWLFIYPDQHVAVVNEFAFPKDVPLDIHLTADTVGGAMTAFMMPRMGTQIFVMSGMQTKLELMSHKQGKFFGKNYQYNGEGFAHMNFDALSMSQQDFQGWLQKVRASGQTLGQAQYAELAKPSDANPVSYYGSVEPNLFHHIIGKYHEGQDADSEKKPAAFPGPQTAAR